jgi:pimeloyl-ACP methyl ester carboxylesterase
MNDIDYIGYIESKMNSLIFKPPDREYLKNNMEAPKYIETFENEHDNDNDNDNDNDADVKMSYFVIHPNEIAHARKSEKKKIRKKLNPPYILWSHGNGCDLIESHSVIKALHSEMGGHVGIVMYDYEGYGLSSGQCRETNCYRDLKIMVKFCRKKLRIPKDRLFLLGHSLGTGVVIHYVSNSPEWRTPIILLSPYKSISRVLVDPHWSDLLTNFAINCLDRFTSIDKYGKINCPVVIYHGMKDSLIDFRHSIELRKLNKKRTTLILLKRAGHNDILSHIDPKEIWNIVFNHINTNNN